MNKTTLHIILLFLILVPIQALVLNNIVLFNVAVPMVFIYLIITLPVTYSANAAMTIGFLMGLAVDILSDTMGVNTMASTILAFVRRPVFHLYVPVDNDLAEQCPSIRNMGVASFLKYASTMTLIYCVLLFTIESLGCFNIGLYLLRIPASAIYTFVLIYALACLTPVRHEKRL